MWVCSSADGELGARKSSSAAEEETCLHGWSFGHSIFDFCYLRCHDQGLTTPGASSLEPWIVHSRSWPGLRRSAAAGMGKPAGEGLRSYYRGKIEELEIQIKDRQHNLHRMEAQRNELNSRGAPNGLQGRPGLQGRHRGGGAATRRRHPPTCPPACLSLCSAATARGAAATPRAGQLRWRSDQGARREGSPPLLLAFLHSPPLLPPRAPIDTSGHCTHRTRLTAPQLATTRTHPHCALYCS